MKTFYRAQHTYEACCPKCNYRQTSLIHDPPPNWIPMCSICWVPSTIILALRGRDHYFPERYLWLDQTAQLLDVEVRDILDWCEKGLIDSRVEEWPDGSQVRFVAISELQRYWREGWNKLLTFENTMTALRSGRNVRFRRPGWPGHSFIEVDQEYFTEGESIRFRYDHILEWDNFTSGSGEFNPTEDDRNACDWYRFFLQPD
jgi:hypothetical protein